MTGLRALGTVVAALAAVAIISSPVAAVDAPHDTLTNNIHCGNCHVTHHSLGDIITAPSDSLISTLCISCHTWGGWPGMGLPFESAMKAVPRTSGSSHAWDVDTLSAAYGAHRPSNTELVEHLRNGKITCTTCHDPHNNTNPHYLRVANTNDSLCFACHGDRNQTSVRTYVVGKIYSHPVNVTLSSTDTTYHNPPLDVNGNPQPSDGNTTNDFVLGAGNIVRCTTCHGVHYTDSDPATVDGP